MTLESEAVSRLMPSKLLGLAAQLEQAEGLRVSRSTLDPWAAVDFCRRGRSSTSDAVVHEVVGFKSCWTKSVV